jgi:oligopeptide/dipeptide ABC transporter ATP-binding protein
MGPLASPPAVATGRIWFEGRDLFALPAAKRRKLRGGAMSMIFQEPMTSLNPVYTVGDQIVEMLRAHGNCSHSAGVARALEVLDLVKIPAARTRMNDYPHQFSGGMRQRVMIAMALACRPRLLIADEPTTALDVTIQAEILDLLREVQTQTGTAILMITHDLGVIAEIADTVAVMYAGKIIEQGSAKDLFNNPQHPYTIGLLGSIPRVGQRRDRLATIEGSVPRLLAHPAGCRFSPRCPFAISQCRGQQPPLVPLDLAHSVACWRAPIEQNLSVSAR